VFGGGDIIPSWGVHYHNPLFGGRFDVDVIDTDTGPADHAQVGRRFDHRLRDPRPTPDNQSMVRGNDAREFLARQAGAYVGGYVWGRLQPFESLRGKVIGH
jgi:hypothetical protein